MENWIFFEGFYVYFIIFIIVGFGDLILGLMVGGFLMVKYVFVIFFIFMGLVVMLNVINGFVNCIESMELFWRLGVCCDKKRSVDIFEMLKINEMELNENYVLEMI